MMRAILFLALLLAGCGPLVQTNPVLGIAQGVVGGGDDGDSQTVGIAARINRDFIEAQPNEMMIASVISREATAVLVRAGNNGTKVTWLSPDGIGVVFDHGVLIATRGLGDDLMGSDVSGTLDAFGNANNYLKVHTFLNGRDQEVTTQFQCSMVRDRRESITIYDLSYLTDVFIETCESGPTSYRNLYWRASDGVIWQSRQWISAEVGYIGYQRL